MEPTTLYAPDGRSLETSLEDDEAVAVLAAAPDLSSFGRDILRAAEKGHLTAGRRYWLHRLALDQSPRQVLGPFPRIAGLILRDPRKKATLRVFTSAGGRVKLFKAGPSSRHAGCILMTNSAAYGSPSARYYGRIDAIGTCTPTSDMTAPVVAALQELEDDPAAALAEFGRCTGTCGVCGRDLTDPASVERGIGPECASRLGID